MSTAVQLVEHVWVERSGVILGPAKWSTRIGAPTKRPPTRPSLARNSSTILRRNARCSLLDQRGFSHHEAGYRAARGSRSDGGLGAAVSQLGARTMSWITLDREPRTRSRSATASAWQPREPMTFGSDAAPGVRPRPRGAPRPAARVDGPPPPVSLSPPNAPILRSLIAAGQVQIGNHLLPPGYRAAPHGGVREEIERNEQWIESTFGISSSCQVTVSDTAMRAGWSRQREHHPRHLLACRTCDARGRRRPRSLGRESARQRTARERSPSLLRCADSARPEACDGRFGTAIMGRALGILTGRRWPVRGRRWRSGRRGRSARHGCLVRPRGRLRGRR
jgi:hypothetical protein